MEMKLRIFSIFIICLNLLLCGSAQKEIQKSREKDPQYQYNLGLFYLNNNNLDEAIKYLDRALSLNPRHYLALSARALAYSIKGNFQEALASFQKCLEINPKFTEAHNYLGTIYQEMGLIDKAEEEFKKALSDKSYSSRDLPYYNLARLYFSQDKLEEALDNVQKSIQISNRLAMAHNLRGLILEKLARVPEAISSYEQAIKIVPDDVNFSFNLAVAYFKNGEFAKAGEIFERISTKVSDEETKNKISEYLKLIKKQKEVIPKSLLSNLRGTFSAPSISYQFLSPWTGVSSWQFLHQFLSVLDKQFSLNFFLL